MLASAWKIASDILNKMAEDGLRDRNVKAKLQSEPDMRNRYLALYNIVDELVMMCQERFAVLATTTRALLCLTNLSSEKSIPCLS